MYFAVTVRVTTMINRYYHNVPRPTDNNEQSIQYYGKKCLPSHCKAHSVTEPLNVVSYKMRSAFLQCIYRMYAHAFMSVLTYGRWTKLFPCYHTPANHWNRRDGLACLGWVKFLLISLGSNIQRKRLTWTLRGYKPVVTVICHTVRKETLSVYAMTRISAATHLPAPWQLRLGHAQTIEPTTFCAAVFP